MKPLAFAAFVLIAAPSLYAQVHPVAPPVSYAWIASPCSNWNCASSALVLANGDPYVIALPTASPDFPWVIVRRVVAGSVWLPPDNPFDAESFDNINLAADRYVSIDSMHAPLLITANGTPLVVSLHQPIARTRSVRR